MSFVAQEKSKIQAELQSYVERQNKTLSIEAYLQVCELKGIEPDLDKIPKRYEDLREEAILVLDIYSKLPNRHISDIGYIGKDYATIPYWMKIYEVVDVKFCMDLIIQLDNYAVEESSKRREQAIEKAKRGGKV